MHVGIHQVRRPVSGLYQSCPVPLKGVHNTGEMEKKFSQLNMLSMGKKWFPFKIFCVKCYSFFVHYSLANSMNNWAQMFIGLLLYAYVGIHHVRIMAFRILKHPTWSWLKVISLLKLLWGVLQFGGHLSKMISQGQNLMLEHSTNVPLGFAKKNSPDPDDRLSLRGTAHCLQSFNMLLFEITSPPSLIIVHVQNT